MPFEDLISGSAAESEARVEAIVDAFASALEWGEVLAFLRRRRGLLDAVVFSGGEPTIAPTWFDALRTAREMGFSHLQCASNGISFTDLDFAYKSKEAGLHTIYLQYDGVTDDIHLKTRGQKMVEVKDQAIENIRKADMKICFVPTVVKGFNDHQVGAIVKKAIENIDVVSAISFHLELVPPCDERREVAKSISALPGASCSHGTYDLLTDFLESVGEAVPGGLARGDLPAGPFVARERRRAGGRGR